MSLSNKSRKSVTTSSISSEKPSLTQSKCLDELATSILSTPVYKNEKKYSAAQSLYNKTGYKVTSKISTTLQGSIYNATSKKGDNIVVKRASLELHKTGMAIIDNKMVSKIEENIKKEAIILNYLFKQKNSPKSLIKIIDFFEDGRNYFLLMENGGISLLKHCINMHKLIYNKIITLKYYKKHIKILFKQMLLFINWLHFNKFAHLDISLENMTIKGFEMKKNKIIKHGQIKFIDFGLSKSFHNKRSFLCKKYVGKIYYQAPKVFACQPYNAAKADIWSLGCCFYSMIFGTMPFDFPNKNCSSFCVIMNKHLYQWCKNTNNTHYVDNDILRIIYKTLCLEHERYYASELLKDKYFS